jgi:putative flippase GtrA
MEKNQSMMKKSDFIAVIVLGEIFAIFLSLILRGLDLVFFPLWILFFILPIAALIGVYVGYLIGKKIPVVFQFAKYATTGLANTAVDFGILNLLMWMTGIYSGQTIFLLNSIAFLIAVTHSYIWNKFWTFRSKDKDVAGQFVQFLAVSLIGILINGAIVYVVTTLVSPMFGLSSAVWANVAKALATLISLIWNFLGYKFVVFKKKNV